MEEEMMAVLEAYEVIAAETCVEYDCDDLGKVYGTEIWDVICERIAEEFGVSALESEEFEMLEKLVKEDS